MKLVFTLSRCGLDMLRFWYCVVLLQHRGIEKTASLTDSSIKYSTQLVSCWVWSVSLKWYRQFYLCRIMRNEILIVKPGKVAKTLHRTRYKAYQCDQYCFLAPIQSQTSIEAAWNSCLNPIRILFSVTTKHGKQKCYSASREWFNCWLQ